MLFMSIVQDKELKIVLPGEEREYFVFAHCVLLK